MKPNEFWQSTYREVVLFVESKVAQYEFELKQQIRLADNLGNKLISASMIAKKPKNINLIKEIYFDLFKEELEKQSIYERKASTGDELIKFMRELDEELKETR